jgi:hypothetical protein
MNRAQEERLLDLAPAGHFATEDSKGVMLRWAVCTCGWREQFNRRCRNALATTSLIYSAIRRHYEDVNRRNAERETGK